MALVMQKTSPLSPFQERCVAAVAKGDTLKEIAHEMHVSHDKIDRALHAARDKMQAKNTVALIATCIRRGIVE